MKFILHGVKIGQGAVIADGSIVTKSIPPYAIATGVPAHVIRFRWDANTILKHEKALYSPSKWIEYNELVQQQNHPQVSISND